MDANLNNKKPLHDVYRTPEDLFSIPNCTHIISLLTVINVHLERSTEGVRVVYPSRQHTFSLRAGKEGTSFLRGLRPALKFDPQFAAFRHLEDFYQSTGATWHNVSPKDPIWEDISTYPEFPFSTVYRPMSETIAFWGEPDSEEILNQGSHDVYGPAEIEQKGHWLGGILHPLSDWLVVEYPGVMKRQIHTLLTSDEKRRHTESSIPKWDQRAGLFVVYGRPPTNWRALRHAEFK